MDVLVLGGSGFVGTALTTRLLELRDNITIFDKKEVTIFNPGVTVRIGYFDNPDALNSILQGRYDVIYHLISETIPSVQQPELDIGSVILPTIRVLKYAVEKRIKIVFVSSGGTVYGNTNYPYLPLSESTPLTPRCSYGISKVTIENYIQMYATLNKLNYTILRFANIYGPNASNRGLQGFIGTSLYNIKRDLPIKIWGTEKIPKDYLYIDDAVQALVCGANDYGTYNVGSGIGLSTYDLLPVFRDITKKGINIEYLPKSPVDTGFILDSLKFRKTGWKPTININEGVQRVWKSL